jgi:hypothetical protein
MLSSDEFSYNIVARFIIYLNSLIVAGNEGFEPPILGPEPSALPLGQFPLTQHELV